MNLNPLHAIDFYKADHRRQYPEGTQLVYSNLTARSNKHSNLTQSMNDGTVTFFGLQYFIFSFLIDSFNEGFFDLPKKEVVRKYKRRMDNALGVDAIPVDHIEALHDLGYLPIHIKALPEGAKVNIKVPMVTIENTIPEFFWLTNYLESVMSAYLWKTTTSATTARAYRTLFNKYAMSTVGNTNFVPFQGHDFSFRGMSGIEDAALSGAAHLLSFVGTDSVLSIDLLEDYYGANSDKELIGCSVPATEHSVMCMGGKEDEIGTFRRLITELYPKGIVSIVSDTWDFWKVIGEYSDTLKPEIMARDGKVVFRPDSGNPVHIICGDPSAQIHSLESKGAVEVLWDIFGGTVNELGYKELDSHVGLIYGDSITPEIAENILEGLKQKGFASTNIVLGIGSYTYNYVTRDTYGMAMKATYGEVNGEARVIYKDPKTDSGVKKSAKGLLKVTGQDGNYVLEDNVTVDEVDEGALETVFYNGECTMVYSLAEIRNRMNGA